MNNKPAVRLRSLQVTSLPVIAGRCHSSNPRLHGRAEYQSGAVLIISLIMLLLLTLIATTGMQTSSLEEKMAGNLRDKNLAFQAAESALKAAGDTLVTAAPIFSAAGTNGFYSATPTPDLSDSEIVKDSFWTTNPVATSTVTGLGNDIATPRYIIQDRGMTCTTSTSPCPTSDQRQNYCVTVRATGSSTNTVVILQSIYTSS